MAAALQFQLAVFPAPQMQTWDTIIGEQNTGRSGFDLWLTASPLLVGQDVPGIPPPYSQAQQNGCAIYVTGLPFELTLAEVENMFSQLAAVVCCPTLVSLGSMETFRWVVFSDRESAQHAARHINEEEGSAGFAGSFLRVIPSLPTGRVISVLGREWTELVEEEDEEEDLTPTQATFHAHPKMREDRRGEELTSKGDEFKTSSALQRQISNPLPVKTTQTPVILTLATPTKVHHTQVSSIGSGKTSDLASAFASTSLSPRLPPVVVPANTPDPFISQAVSWANIASQTQTLPQDRIINVQATPKRARLTPVGRIPKISRVRNTTANLEPLAEQKRVILLLNLPNNIQLKDISDAVREGPLVKIVFGQNDDDKSRYAGIIFHKASDAARFYEVLQNERRLSRPNRFRFIVDVVIGDPFPMNDEIRSMEKAPFATRRLTIVKARFFFMFKEEHLQRLCENLVGAKNIQLLWLYNGGNATVVFADVGSAMKVKKELDRRAAMAGQKGGESEIWSGLHTTFSKDPCIFPLEDLKTTFHD